MTDRNVQYPYRFHVRPVSGTDDICEIIPAPGTVYEDGTFWNKQNVLKDDTAALFSLTSKAVPDDVFKKLSFLILESVNLTNTKAVVVTGSYTGNGATSKTINFSFTPKIVFVGPNNNTTYAIFLFGGKTNTPLIGSSSGDNIWYAFSGKSLDIKSATTRLNASGVIYSYIAIG